MKIVVDTNVFISGIFWGGLPGKILEMWSDTSVQVLFSNEILSEYVEVIKRIAPEISDHWKNFIKQNGLLIKPKGKIDICRDADDNKFIECAIAGKAKVIVSGDLDLLVIKKYRSVQILKPRDFLLLV